jgi:hypothetical protein
MNSYFHQTLDVMEECENIYCLIQQHIKKPHECISCVTWGFIKTLLNRIGLDASCFLIGTIPRQRACHVLKITSQTASFSSP